MNPSNVHIFCIGHTELFLKIPESAYLVRTSRGHLADDAHNNLVSLNEVSEELDFYYPWLGGTAGLLSIPDVFRQKNIKYLPGDRVMIFQQAKIVTSKLMGWKSMSYPGMRLLPPWLAQGIDIESICNDCDKFLFPQLVSLPGGDMKLYAHIHHLPDYLRFCAVAIDEGVLTTQQALEMSQQDIMIPGGGLLGLSPVEYFLDAVETAKRASIAFLSKYSPGLKSPYQRIAAGYLIERMSSYFLLKSLSTNYGGVPNNFIGTMIAISNSDYKHGSSSI